MASRFTTTTKDVGLLLQLKDDGQLSISPEFQRNAVWSRPAKAYLIDTILTGNPIPVLYFQRSISAQTSRVEYAVIDGQQRLNAVFSFMDNRFSLTESSPDSPWHKKRWKDLRAEDREAILSYDFVVQELKGYSLERVREMFQRMNRYVVALNPQELRHSNADGQFKKVVEEIGSWPFWQENRVVTKQSAARMKSDELVAELIILLNEGPQDKKESVDLYYATFADEFIEGSALRARLESILDVVQKLLPDLKATPLRRPANLYALVGAIAELEADEMEINAASGARHLLTFIGNLDPQVEDKPRIADDYLVASSRQTDNIRPRRARIDILKRVLLEQD